MSYIPLSNQTKLRPFGSQASPGSVVVGPAIIPILQGGGVSYSNNVGQMALTGITYSFGDITGVGQEQGLFVNGASEVITRLYVINGSVTEDVSSWSPNGQVGGSGAFYLPNYDVMVDHLIQDFGPTYLPMDPNSVRSDPGQTLSIVFTQTFLTLITSDYETSEDSIFRLQFNPGGGWRNPQGAAATYGGAPVDMSAQQIQQAKPRY